MESLSRCCFIHWIIFGHLKILFLNQFPHCCHFCWNRQNSNVFCFTHNNLIIERVYTQRILKMQMLSKMKGTCQHIIVGFISSTMHRDWLQCITWMWLALYSTALLHSLNSNSSPLPQYTKTAHARSNTHAYSIVCMKRILITELITT